MKNYLVEFNDDVTLALNEITQDLSNEINGKTFESPIYGTCTIINVRNFSNNLNNEVSPVIKISSQTKDCEIYYTVALKQTKLNVPEDVNNTIQEYIIEATKIFERQKELEIEARKQKEIEDKNKLEQIKLDEKKKELDDKKEKDKLHFTTLANNLSNGNRDKLINGSFYVGLGYIANHAKNVTAVIPDYLTDWFDKEFGTVDRRTINTQKLNAAGLPVKANLEFQIELDSNKNIPNYLYRFLKDSRADARPVSNLDFVYELVKNYGFKFGKDQDITEITARIPNNELENFKLGLNA